MNKYGGHLNKVHTDLGVLCHISNTFKTNTMIDIGCGPGWQSILAAKTFSKIVAVDGDPGLVWPENSRITWVRHNYFDGPSNIAENFDLAWSCEFVEHIPEQFVSNYMEDFKKAKIAAITYHPPKTDNPYHHNEQPEEYWIDLFKNHGFAYDAAFTKSCKIASTMVKPFFVKHGLVFFK